MTGLFYCIVVSVSILAIVTGLRRRHNTTDRDHDTDSTTAAAAA
eukprot:CAMPEP_0202473600 /NCGR_PEP_ID=MMETSP1360-20130828/91459_1 /ASSEMBLY_ACC=CAM_ASM_000848 /TAXON_ID=515479 /ORGANISM="Licmophora paradoxa, Strain CCMP2313" /LENGTH=43 /DNA_ID= /DNA_START= /DNA_END= /DNA_ORIENTATION=